MRAMEFTLLLCYLCANTCREAVKIICSVEAPLSLSQKHTQRDPASCRAVIDIPVPSDLSAEAILLFRLCSAVMET